MVISKNVAYGLLNLTRHEQIARKVEIAYGGILTQSLRPYQLRFCPRLGNPRSAGITHLQQSSKVCVFVPQ